MRKFQKQETPEHIYVIAIDTLCDGHSTGYDEDDNIPLFTKEEAEEELKELLEFEIECCDETPPDEVENPYFMIHMDEYVDGRKCVFRESNGKLEGVITGEKPIKL